MSHWRRTVSPSWRRRLRPTVATHVTQRSSTPSSSGRDLTRSRAALSAPGHPEVTSEARVYVGIGVPTAGTGAVANHRSTASTSSVVVLWLRMHARTAYRPASRVEDAIPRPLPARPETSAEL